MRLDYHSPESLAPVIEALLFASDEPLSAQTLRSVILGEETVRTEVQQESLPESDVASDEAPQIEGETAIELESDSAPAGTSSPEKKPRKKRQLIELVTIHVAVQHLNSIYDSSERAFRVVEIAGGYQFATRSDHSEYVARLFKEKSRRRLSGAALESLAIIAYKQPVSKMDVENIRGVNCDEVLKSLLEKNLITITGRSEAVGRPLLYGTTVDFLRHFGLHTLSDLPRPREIEELMKEEAVRATTLDEAASEFVSEANMDEITVDEVLAVAHELGEREEAVIAESTGIELDLNEMAAMNPGHPAADVYDNDDAVEEAVIETEFEEQADSE